jgi:pyruvate,orthophosphate dikinase
MELLQTNRCRARSYATRAKPSTHFRRAASGLRVGETHVRVEETEVRLEEREGRVGETHVRVGEREVRVGGKHVRFDEREVRVEDTQPRVSDSHVRLFDSQLQVEDPEVRVEEIQKVYPRAVTERLLARGQVASPGRATGPVAFSPEAVLALDKKGAKPILVRTEAGAEDAAGVRAAAALVTTRAGITGDGAIMARALGKPCLAGCPDVVVRAAEGLFTVADVTVREGDVVTVDASAGELYLG